MKRLYKLRLMSSPWLNVYEGNDTVAGGGGDDTVAGGGGGDTVIGGAGDDDKPTISQKKMNAILAEEKRKYKKQTEGQIKELETLKKSNTVSAQDKTALQTRIEELQNSLMTKEQLTEKERKQQREETKKLVEGLTKDRDTWKTRFEGTTITRSILDEAITAEAYNPRQVVELLRGNTRLVEVLDAEGKPIDGEFVAKVKMQDTDKDGKPTTLDLTVAEALKRMKDRVDDFGNLFKANLKGGLGSGTNSGGGKDVDPSKLTGEEYRKWRNNRMGRKSS